MTSAVCKVIHRGVALAEVEARNPPKRWNCLCVKPVSNCQDLLTDSGAAFDSEIREFSVPIIATTLLLSLRTYRAASVRLGASARSLARPKEEERRQRDAPCGSDRPMPLPLLLPPR